MTQQSSWSFVQMTSEAADRIAAWRYQEPYGFYDLQKDAKDLAEFMDPESWRIGELGQRDTTVAVHREGELAGFFSFARDRWGVSSFRLEVASFNQGAIRVYERCGFDKRRTLVREDGGVSVEFVEMTR